MTTQQAGAPTVVTADARRVTRARRPARLPVLLTGTALVVVVLLATAVGPVTVGVGDVATTLLSHVPLLHVHSSGSAADQAIVWELRLPRVLLAALVGALLAGSGASYQGVLRNSLADPYLLGTAAGAGLGATVAIVAGTHSSLILPVSAFAGAVLAVLLTLVIAAGGTGRASGYTVVLAGVAVAAMLTAVQTYLQQQHVEEIRQIYNWLLGSFSVASWSDVRLVLPYAVVSTVVLLLHRRTLDVLRVGADEAGTLGVHPTRSRMIIIGGATLGTAAAVSVSGLIGFVGIVVPHAVRLTMSASYRVVLPVSMLGGAIFLVVADLVARTVQAPSELPVGVVTAVIGAPFFLVVLRSRRTRQGVL